MEVFIFIIWVMFAVAIPIVLIQAGLFQYYQQIAVARIIFRFLIAISLYVCNHPIK